MSRQLKSPDELENTFIDERVSVLLPKFEALAPYKRKQREVGVQNEDLEGWKVLATKEAALLKSYYPDDKPENEKEYGACLRQITALKKGLKKAAKTDILDHANYHPVLTIITHFGNALSYLFSEYKTRQNTRYREKVESRSTVENRVSLDLSPFLKYAHETLDEIASGASLEDVDWRDVSCAIALATGRRMAEIHLSGEFRKVGEYELGFKGQLKGKRRKIGLKKLIDHEFTIPTLLSAERVLRGVEWLDANGKRFPRDEDPERVNRTYSKRFNGRDGIVRENWEILREGMTYHKFRGAYFRACVVNALVDPLDYLNFARSILGDRDETTIRAYQRFEIKPNSLTKI